MRLDLNREGGGWVAMTTLSHKSGPTQPNHYSYHSEHTAQFIIQLVYAALSRDCSSHTRAEPGLASHARYARLD